MAPKSRGGGGSLSRRAAVALIGGGGLLGLSGTGAFSQVDGERPFEVSTSTDANALLGIETLKDAETYQAPYDVTITNQLNERLNDNSIKSNGNVKFKRSDGSLTSELEMPELDAYSGSGEPDSHSFTIVIPGQNEEENRGGNRGGSRGIKKGKEEEEDEEEEDEEEEDEEEEDEEEEDEEVSDKITILYSGSDTTIKVTRQITVT